MGRRLNYLLTVACSLVLFASAPAEAGTLYRGNLNRYFEVDPSDGSMTNIAFHADFDIFGMTYHSGTGKLYGGNEGRFFEIIDPTDGSMTSIDFPAQYDIEALAYHPVTGTLYGGNGGRFFSIDPSDGSMDQHHHQRISDPWYGLSSRNGKTLWRKSGSILRDRPQRRFDDEYRLRSAVRHRGHGLRSGDRNTLRRKCRTVL